MDATDIDTRLKTAADLVDDITDRLTQPGNGHNATAILGHIEQRINAKAGAARMETAITGARFQDAAARKLDELIAELQDIKESLRPAEK